MESDGFIYFDVLVLEMSNFYEISRKFFYRIMIKLFHRLKNSLIECIENLILEFELFHTRSWGPPLQQDWYLSLTAWSTQIFNLSYLNVEILWLMCEKNEDFMILRCWSRRKNFIGTLWKICWQKYTKRCCIGVLISGPLKIFRNRSVA